MTIKLTPLTEVYEDTYFVTQPRFETGDARYHRLNHMMAVAEGRCSSSRVEYRVYALKLDSHHPSDLMPVYAPFRSAPF